jgi:hypothetical protein
MNTRVPASNIDGRVTNRKLELIYIRLGYMLPTQLSDANPNKKFRYTTVDKTKVGTRPYKKLSLRHEKLVYSTLDTFYKMKDFYAETTWEELLWY